MSPSLGWLQAFLCAADHLDYERAAKDLGIRANTIHRRVLKLEGWLSKLLIMDDPVELSEHDGRPFSDIARDVLQRFEATCSFCKNDLIGRHRTRIGKKISNIRLDDFERFLSVADQGSYKGAASLIACNVTTVQRSVQALEEATGKQFFAGRSSLKLSADGETFSETAVHIVKSLNDFRAMPTEDDIFRALLKKYQRYLTNRQAHLQSVVSLISNTGKKQRGKVRLDDVLALMKSDDRLLDKMNKEFGPLNRTSGASIDMSFYTDAKAKK